MSCSRLRKVYRSVEALLMCFLDACFITVGEFFISQKKRCWGRSAEDILEKKRIKTLFKTSSTASVFGAVWRCGRNKLFVMPFGFRFNQVTYQNECLTPLLEYLEECLNLEDVCYTRIKHPCNAAKTAQKFLDIFFPQYISKDNMPAKSHNLNLLDYSIWTALEKALAKHKNLRNFAHLKELLLWEWDAIPQEHIEDTLDV